MSNIAHKGQRSHLIYLFPIMIMQNPAVVFRVIAQSLIFLWHNLFTLGIVHPSLILDVIGQFFQSQ